MTTVALHNEPGDHPVGTARSPRTGDDAAAIVTELQSIGAGDYLYNGHEMNQVARTGRLSRGNLTKVEARESIQLLDDELDGLPPLEDHIQTYRGVMQAPQIFGTESIKGRTFTDRGFISTTTDKFGAMNFGDALIEVHTPSGFKAGKLTSNFDKTGEIILPRHTTFRVVEDNADPRSRQMTFEVISQGQ